MAKLRDDSDRARDGDLPLDPFEGTERVLPPAEDAPPKDKITRPDLEGEAPTLSSLYGLPELEADEQAELVSLATLPGWDGSKPEDTGHGWGAPLDKVIGGGIRRGCLLGVGAASAGAGKTSWVMQPADGLALRTAELLREEKPGPLTPVLILSEMSAPELSWRSLARWTAADSRIFRAGKSAAAMLEGRALYPDVEVKRAWTEARKALSGPLGEARRFTRLLQTEEVGVALVERLSVLVSQWREKLAKEHKRDVWPVIVIDPIQRFQGDEDEVRALNTTMRRLQRRTKAEGWVVFLTSDTNKPSAAGGNERKDKREEGRGAFRGSYLLQHLVDIALYLTRPDEDSDRPELETVIVKNRWGSNLPPWPRYSWNVMNGRFEPKPAREKLK